MLYEEKYSVRGQTKSMYIGQINIGYMLILKIIHY